jgi:hypothetical protein
MKTISNMTFTQKMDIAEHAKTDPHRLTLLSYEESQAIREAVAKNKYTPTNTLIRLSGDPDRQVRCNIANNPATPTYILMYYCQTDEDDHYVCRASREALKKRGFALRRKREKQQWRYSFVDSSGHEVYGWHK